MIVKCVVACTSTEGPDFYFCKVDIAESDYDVGAHYDLAEQAASEDGYGGLMVVFDENDGPDWLFERFVWDSATVVVSDTEDEDETDEEDEEENEEDD